MQCKSAEPLSARTLLLESDRLRREPGALSRNHALTLAHPAMLDRLVKLVNIPSPKTTTNPVSCHIGFSWAFYCNLTVNLVIFAGRLQSPPLLLSTSLGCRAFW